MPKHSSKSLLEAMTHESIYSLVLRLGVPTTISMLMSALYNATTTYYVSFLGTSAVAAMGVIFVLMNLILAIGLIAGQGCAAQSSRLLGAQKTQEANQVASSAFFVSLLLAALLAIVCLVFLEPLLRVMGATPTVMPYAKDFAWVLLLTAPFLSGIYAFNCILRSEGQAFSAMVSLVLGGLLNIIVTPLFVFVFDWGMIGAGLGTALGHLLSFVLLANHYYRNKGSLRIHHSLISKSLSTYRSILLMGLPTMARQTLAIISISLLNFTAATFGDAALAGMSIVLRVIMISNAFVVGIGQGYQPVLGFNWGAQNYARVKEALDKTFLIGLLIMGFLGLFVGFFATSIVQFFIENDPVVLEVGVSGLKAYALVTLLLPFNIYSNMTYQVLGCTTIATFLASLRQGICFFPVILTLPHFWGIHGVEWAQPVSECLAFGFCLYAVIHFRQSLNIQSSND